MKSGVPTSDDTRVKVLLQKPLKLATAKADEVVDLEGGLKVMWAKQRDDGNGGEKDGAYNWQWRVEANEKVVLEAVWEVRAPSDLLLSEVLIGF